MYRFGVHADDVLADGQAGAGQGRADGEPFPVVLGDIGRADAGNDPRAAELDAFVVAEVHFEVHGGEDGLVAVGLDAVRADAGAHDVEVGVVNRINLFGRGRDDAERLRIDDFVAAVRGLADFAHADAAVNASDAHAGVGSNRTFGPVLG